jgi:hypothetical protein
MPGAIIYQGPSLLDGEPIFVAAVWSSTNRKTGNMLQTYIMRSDMDPLTASKWGEDASVCGDCRHRGEATLDPMAKQAKNRSCYVVLGQGPLVVYKAFKRGAYPNYDDPVLRRSLGFKAVVRIGTYGDGAAVPQHVWDELLREASGHTAYTHNGGDHQRYMISVDSLPEAKQAWTNKHRTFRVVRSTDEIVKSKEIECPSERGVQCADCRLCGGSQTRAKSIAIVVHGGGAKHFAS